MDFSKIRNFVFLALLAAVTIAFFSVIKTFAYPIVWAAIIAAVFYPVYRAINKKLNVPNLSTAITMMMVLIVIIVPLILASILVVKESFNLYSSVANSNGEINANIHNTIEWIKNNPYTAKLNIDQAFGRKNFPN